MPSYPIRPMLSVLIPLALGACMNAGPTATMPSAVTFPLGADLGASGGRQAHSSATNPAADGRDMRHSSQMGDMPMPPVGQ